MTVLARFHGPNYCAPREPEHVLVFPDIDKARDWLDHASWAGHREAIECAYADGHTDSALMPCVYEGHVLDIVTVPYDPTDPEPDLMAWARAWLHDGEVPTDHVIEITESAIVTSAA